MKPAFLGLSRDSCHAQGHDKTDAQYFRPPVVLRPGFERPDVWIFGRVPVTSSPAVFYHLTLALPAWEVMYFSAGGPWVLPCNPHTRIRRKCVRSPAHAVGVQTWAVLKRMASSADNGPTKSLRARLACSTTPRATCVLRPTLHTPDISYLPTCVFQLVACPSQEARPANQSGNWMG